MISGDQVAPGVYRLGTRWASFYLVASEDGAVLIDAGYPRYLRQLEQLLHSLGKSPDWIAAVIVTHHHVDHVGTAEAVRQLGASGVFAHARDADKVSGRRRSQVPPNFYRNSWRPSMVRYLAHSVAAGGARYRAVGDVVPLVEGHLDVPRSPRIVETPGHTAGHCSVLLEDAGVLFTGDALVNFDYASGETGVKLHRFNEDRDAAIGSLEQFASLDAPLLLFGHGDPWSLGAQAAVQQARDIG